MSNFRVVHGGPLTTVQDMGRPGLGAHGIAEGGAMDRRALARANHLVGNEAGAPGLEFTLQGPELVWQGDVDIIVAVAGDDERVFTVAPEGVLDAIHLKRRARGYIAFAGGLQVEREAGGRGACLAGGFGGVVGRGLREGDHLPVVDLEGAQSPSRPTGRPGEAAHEGFEDEAVRLRVLPVEGAPLSAVSALLDYEWSAGEGNRAGLHLAGPTVMVPPLSMSSPTCPGAIQVTGAGQPIILLRDHPTVGGYPIVAVVIQADLDVCGQVRSGARISFHRVNEEEAVTALRQAD